MSRWSRCRSASPPNKFFDCVIQNIRFGVAAYGVTILVAVLMLLLYVFRANGRPEPAGGWRAIREITPLTVIDTAAFRWMGDSSARSEFPVGRITIRSIARNSLLRERMLADSSVQVHGRRLIAVEVDTLLSLISGTQVLLIGWNADADTAYRLGQGQIVTVTSGRAVVSIPADSVARAAMFQKAGRLAIVRLD